MAIFIFPFLAIFTLGGLLYAEAQQDLRLKWIFKPLTSLLFVLTGLANGIDGTYAQLIVLGLILGMAGDILLIPKKESWFLAGLITFLLGHIAYVVAFNTRADIGLAFRDLPVLVGIIGLIGLGVYAGLFKQWGAMKLPVGVYLVVITSMVFSAIAIYAQKYDPVIFRRLVLVGAICFYFSDLAVSLDTFVKPKMKQAYWGLPLYYLAQFLLAFSIRALQS